MKITSEQNRRLHKLLAEQGPMENKGDLVLSHTGGRTEHSSRMDTREAAALIKALVIDDPSALKGISPKRGEKTPNFTGCFSKPGNKIRRAIMSMAYTLGIINGKMSNIEKIAAIDEYVLEHPKTAKDFRPFTELDVKGLQALHYQFEKFLMHKLGK